MRIQFYGHEPLPQGRSLFLAGPTTDSMADGRRDLGDGLIMSAWRARFVSALIEELFLESPACDGLTIVVPEFHNKGEGPDWFAAQAAAMFGGGQGVLKWEEEHMAHADLVVAWGDVRRKQPGLGLNARPEIYGLMLRMFLREGCGTWAPKRLLLGVPSSAQAAGRYHLLAEQLKIDVFDSLLALAKTTARFVRWSSPSQTSARQQTEADQATRSAVLEDERRKFWAQDPCPDERCGRSGGEHSLECVNPNKCGRSY